MIHNALSYYRILILKAIYSDDYLIERFVLKGGTAIDIIYKVNKRASSDVDLSMAGDFEEIERKEVSTRIQCALETQFNEHGFKVDKYQFQKSSQQGWTGYQIMFSILSKRLAKLPRDIPRPPRLFTIDISGYERCDQKNVVELDGYNISVYTPKMLVIEKLRAICQQIQTKDDQPRAKDFFDIFTIVQHFNLIFGEEDVKLTQEVFSIKKLELNLLMNIESKREYFSMGIPELQDTLTTESREEFNFDKYFKGVTDIAENIYKCFNEKERSVFQPT